MRKIKLRKIKRLLEDQSHQNGNTSPNPPDFAPSVINLTLVNFSEHDLRFLGKGKTFAIPPLQGKEKMETVLVADIAAGIRCGPRLSSDRIKSLISSSVQQFDRPPSQFTRTFLSIKEKLKRDGLIIAKAGKGEALVRMIKNQYEQKLLDFLHQAGASLTDYKFATHNETIRGKIRKAQYLITWTQKSGERFYIMNPAFPKIYGSCPVVAFFTDPSFHLAKFLTDWFRATSNFETQYIIKSSFELTAKLYQVKFPVISFDVVNMFTKIPVKRTIDIMAALRH